jgi:hypothetical protein
MVGQNKLVCLVLSHMSLAKVGNLPTFTYAQILDNPESIYQGQTHQLILNHHAQRHSAL